MRVRALAAVQRFLLPLTPSHRGEGGSVYCTECDLHKHQHDSTSEAAAAERKGFRVLRFWNNQVLTEIGEVTQTIMMALDEDIPSPSDGRGLG